jgi:hypothetical protein
MPVVGLDELAMEEIGIDVHKKATKRAPALAGKPTAILASGIGPWIAELADHSKGG